MKSLISFVILSLILVSCTLNTQVSSPQPSTKVSTALTANTTLTSVNLASTATMSAASEIDNSPISTTPTQMDWKTPVITSTPMGSKIGGIVGVYSTVKPSSDPNGSVMIFGGDFYDLFRFYDDGTVLGVKVGITTSTINESWPEIRLWFNKSLDTGQGEYRILNNHIWFHIPPTNNNTVATDYSGIFSNYTMILDSYDNRAGTSSAKVEYFLLENEIP